MRIPFDISKRPQIESGEYKVETGDGRSVRIISWDKKVFGGSTEIVALVPTPEGNTEIVQLYCPDGKLIASSWNEKFKLFIVTPEPELTEWQRFISACLQKHGLLDCGAADRIAKNCSTELLDLARKELENDAPSIIHAQSFNAGLKHGKADALKDLQENLANNDVYSVPEWLREVLLMAKENGKKEALKDLPRWKKCDPHTIYDTKCKFVVNGIGRYIILDGYMINVDRLEKLPGFKEDESHE